AAQRAGIEHARVNDDRAYLGRKPSYTREQFNQAREMLGQQAVGVAKIARDTRLTRQTIYRIKDNPAAARRLLWLLGGCNLGACRALMAPARPQTPQTSRRGGRQEEIALLFEVISMLSRMMTSACGSGRRSMRL